MPSPATRRAACSSWLILVRLHRRQPRALCLARVVAEAGRPVRADLARGRAGPQQSAAHHRLRDGVRRHALSAGARSLHRRQDLGRRAVLQRSPSARCSCRSLIAMPFGPLLAWKRGDLLGVAQRLMCGLWRRGADRRRRCVRLRPGAGRSWRRSRSGSPRYVIVGALVDIAERIGLFRLPLVDLGAPRRGLPRVELGHGASPMSASACRCSASSAR